MSTRTLVSAVAFALLVGPIGCSTITLQPRSYPKGEWLEEEVEVSTSRGKMAPLHAPSSKADPGILEKFRDDAEVEADAYVAWKKSASEVQSEQTKLLALELRLEDAKTAKTKTKTKTDAKTLDALVVDLQLKVDTQRDQLAGKLALEAQDEAKWDAADEALSRAAAKYLKAPYDYAYEQLMLRCAVTEVRLERKERQLTWTRWSLFGLSLATGVSTVGLSVAPRSDIPRDTAGAIDQAALDERLQRNHRLNVGAAATGAATAALGSLLASTLLGRKADEVRTRRAEVAAGIHYAAATWNSYSWISDPLAGTNQWEPLTVLGEACSKKEFDEVLTPEGFKKNLDNLKIELEQIKNDARGSASDQEVAPAAEE